MALFEVNRKKAMDGDTKYSRSLKVPQYKPKDKKPNIKSLVDFKKYSQLLKSINESSVSEDEKLFLKFAASRHLVFNYSLIADYYANSDEEMQKLMEESALVILDIDDAIADGYVTLSRRMEELVYEARKARGKLE